MFQITISFILTVNNFLDKLMSNITVSTLAFLHIIIFYCYMLS